MISSCEKTLFTENGKEIKLIYSITKSDCEIEGEVFRPYGIRIDKFESGNLTESAEIPNITLKTLEIDRLFVLLSNNTVTPVCLKEVVEDYLADVFCGG